MTLTDRFSEAFKQEHRQVRDLLFDLIEAFPARDAKRTQALLRCIAELTGPHFRYEEEALYPSLIQIYGSEYIEDLLRAHDRIIGTAQRLVELASKPALDDEEVARAVRLTRSILPHVSDCDGLSIMVECLPERDVQQVLHGRNQALAAGLDLIRWSAEVRSRPVVAAD